MDDAIRPQESVVALMATLAGIVRYAYAQRILRGLMLLSVLTMLTSLRSAQIWVIVIEKVEFVYAEMDLKVLPAKGKLAPIDAIMLENVCL